MIVRIRVRFALVLLLLPGFFSSAHAQFPPLIEASEITSGDGLRGFIMQGETEGAGLPLRLGSGVSAVGDLNADGRDDFAISAIGADPNGSDSGQVFVVFGRDTAFPNPFDLSSLDGNDGFVINGESLGHILGSSISPAGDMNGDGFDDMAVCARNASPNGILSGRCYVLFGNAAGFPATLELSALDGSNGFAINGEADLDGAGRTVRPAGDINADGLDDLLIAAIGADPNGLGSGRVYIVYGDGAGFANEVELSALNGANGVILNGAVAEERAGTVLAGIHDINNDGIDDVAIGANLSGGPYRSYVVSGNPAGLPSPFELAALDGSNGFFIEDTAGNSAIRVYSAGDFNADGFADLSLSVTSADFNGLNSGRVYVLLGPISAFAAVLDLATLDASNAVVIDGENAGDVMGGNVINAGDINGDGVDDLAITANQASPNGNQSGRAYVIFGSATIAPGLFNLGTLNGSNGFAINGEFAEDQFGGSISGLGDINGDGLDDLILSAFQADPNGIVDGGRSYVIYGRTFSSIPRPVPVNNAFALCLMAGLLLGMAWFRREYS